MTFSQLKALGITPKHLAKLLGINRVTASGWMNGHSAPHPMVNKKADRVLVAAREASESGELPPPVTYKGVERDNYVVHTVASRIAKKPQP